MSRKTRLTLIFCFVLALTLQFLKLQPIKDTVIWGLIKRILINTLIGAGFTVLAFDFGYKLFNRVSLKGFFMALPCLLVSLNNFPIIAAVSQRAQITAGGAAAGLFFIECLSVAFFEEVCFRGIVFLIILSRLKKDRLTNFKAVVYSSAVFSLAHILNVFGGAGIGETALQVGYTFLTGSMWAIVALMTGGVFAGIILHAVYNFGGLVFLQYGSVYYQWDAATVALTAALSAVVGVYLLYAVFKMPPNQGKRLFVGAA